MADVVDPTPATVIVLEPSSGVHFFRDPSGDAGQFFNSASMRNRTHDHCMGQEVSVAAIALPVA